MTRSAQLNPTSILVIGLGLTGYSIVKYLASNDCHLCVSDTRDLPPYLDQVKREYPAAELMMGNIPYDRFHEFDQIIVSPGIELSELSDAEDLTIIGDIELFAQDLASRAVSTPLIAITGSNGKSTVTMLVTEILQAAGLNIKTGGNIGTPVLDLFDQHIPDFYVLELSSFQLESTHTLKPVCATVLNISEDHMDRYRGEDDYVDAKMRIFNSAGHRIVNRDDPITMSRLSADSDFVSFGLSPPDNDAEYGVIEDEGKQVMVRGQKIIGQVSESALQGEQNIANMLAAFALVESAGVELKPNMIKAAMNYGGLPHRCEMVGEVNQVKWINDSKGTNVGATVAAINGFQQPIILILGGKSKGADFAPLARAIASKQIEVVVFGEDAEIILSSLNPDAQCIRVGDLEAAVAEAHRLSSPGSVVLFSPACASFDMFDNYEHRGNVFKQLVMERVH